jgi:phage host-nuclease inhibitor protein Gam
MTISSKLKALLPTAPKTVEDLRQTVREAAATAYQIDRLKAERDEAVAAVTETHSLPLTQAEKKLKGLVAALKAWATGHRSEFAGKQAIQIESHTIAFRKSPGKLASEAKDEEIIEAILGSDDDELIELALTVKPALDKVAIKSALQTDSDLSRRIASFGFQIERGETFTFEPARVEDHATL